MAYITRSIFLCELGSNLRIHGPRQFSGYFTNGNWLARSDVQGHAISLRRFHGQQVSADYIFHADEVTQLSSIFKDQRRVAIDESRGKDCGHAGIRIGKRLSRSVNIEITQSHRWQAVCTAEEQTHLFLVFFGKRINGAALERLGFIRGDRRERLTARGTVWLPLPDLELIDGAKLWRHAATLRAKIFSFAIDRHGRRQHQLLHAALAIQYLLQQHCGSLRVGAHVTLDFIHGLAHADGCGHMKDNVNARERAPYSD